MAMRFRPRLEGLEARETPTSLGSELLGVVPNPSQNVPVRQVEIPTQEAEPGVVVDWSMDPAPADSPVAIAFAAVSDSAWTGWAAENSAPSSENLVVDWVFTESANAV